MTKAALRRRAIALPPWVPAVGVGVVTLGIAMAVVTPYVVGAFHDDAIYVILGRSLASGAGYRYTHLPGSPSATHYPPLYPALLSVLWRIAPRFPANIIVFERVNAVLLACSAVLAYILARWRVGLSAPWASLVALAGTATIPPLALAGMVLSESLFLAVLLVALLLAERVAGGRGEGAGAAGPAGTGARGDGVRDSPTGLPARRAEWWRDAVVAGVLCGAVGLVRSVGLVVVPAAVVACLIRGRRREALVLGAAAVATVLPWQVWAWTHSAELAPILQGEYGTYSGWLTGALHRHGLAFAMATARRNVSDGMIMLETLLAPRLPAVVKELAVVACLTVVTVGLPRFARAAPVTLGFAVLYAGEVLFWPFPPLRFVWAAWVFLMLALAMGTVTVWDWRPVGWPGTRARAARLARRVAVTACVLLAVALLRYNVLGYRGRWWHTMQDGLSGRMTAPLAWLAAHPTLPGVVVSDQEPAFYLYAGRTGLPCNSFTPDEYVYPRDTARDRAVLDAVLRRFPVGSVVITGPACTLAVLRLAGARFPELVAVDTLTPGLAVFERPPQ